MPEAVGLVIDIETTGFSARDEVIEVGAVLFGYNTETGRITELLDQCAGLREPDVPIRAAAAAVNGLTEEMVRGQALDVRRLRYMIEIADLIFAHNAAFDQRFISKLFPRAAVKPWACTMSQVQWALEMVPRRNLDAIAAHYGISRPSPHRAIHDAKVVLSLLRRRNHRGVAHIHELHRAAFPQSSSAP